MMTHRQIQGSLATAPEPALPAAPPQGLHELSRSAGDGHRDYADGDPGGCKAEEEH